MLAFSRAFVCLFGSIINNPRSVLDSSRVVVWAWLCHRWPWLAMPNGVTFAVWMLISDADKLSMAMVACDAHIFIIVVCYVVCVSFSRGPPKIHFSCLVSSCVCTSHTWELVGGGTYVVKNYLLGAERIRSLPELFLEFCLLLRTRQTAKRKELREPLSFTLTHQVFRPSPPRIDHAVLNRHPNPRL